MGDSRPVTQSLKEYARGIAGGLLFSFPLLYTMEVWWHGFFADPFQLISLVIVTFLLLLGYNRYAGVREDATWKHIAVDSVEEMGIGLVVSFGVLLMLNRISFSPFNLADIGKVIIEGMAVSIGVSIGTAQLGTEGGGGKQNNKSKDSHKEGSQGDDSSRRSRAGIAVLALCGAILIGSNVAPTEEIIMLAVEAQPIHILMMALVSLALSVMIVFFSDFKGAEEKPSGSPLYNIVFDTCISYLMGLGSSVFVLWFFGRFEDLSFYVCFAQVITLGVLASVGASAGRLLIK
ncbi:putative integral membrane protein (TIGR02587 family) [Pontibacter ummariensis]|uniref:Putative integral membrane protein TIGR02587 n=1 Tax=Pontibacter ummariensis TaxID=1610492 RepID=A0A239LGY9_9BACT|nr:TIGR02587 family membrane protein [Pontibacter ummariensis]PRY03389.1 putative integral membrane protein (TIGR02587 family) [Pontibacter ummariensis]SNT29138.1 putative integral membrane protein TIGR02587 [Pontibacter ummariensis]